MSRKRPKTRPVASKAEAGRTPWPFELWLKRHPRSITAALIAIACIWIAATYTVFNHTVDEPVHIAAGMEWLDKGVYRYEAQHPPLARVMSAVGPCLLGIRSQGKEAQHEGTGILYSGGRYDRNLAASRAGILPFFIVASVTVYVWANWAFGPPVAVMAVLLFTSLPPVLAHAGLSTTDMALTAFLGAAFLSALLWAERPSLKRSVVFGVTAALAALSKLSFLAFFPVCAAASLVCYFAIHRATLRQRLRALAANWFPYTRGLAVAVVVAALVIWAGYRFSFAYSSFVGARVPAPELFAGIQEVINHNKEGHVTYLLGERSESGFWYYYPVVLAVKTPLAFHALLFAGIVACARKKLAGLWFPALAFPAGILLVGLFSRINIGVRHILPVYIGFAIVAAGGLAYLLDLARRAAWAKAAAG
ncbi:MAG TPA: glycosyl transferase [Bryobacteraceae bacterium]|nr:glycosyl transferase [Bryobacteraceae bacterium]HOQ44232.1 glycosyl transferase [Bryobacteraceae bacterium]HPQ15015.1 glycosyl transferase [Bryobacteraceae bacterium]HPU70550.1 glycosyl transferase [Bryobacteraceae bacterium]